MQRGGITRGSSSFGRLLSRKDAENLLRVVMHALVDEYHVSQQDILEVFNEVSEDTVPSSIFASKLSPSEALVKFLKEEKGMTYHEIAMAINRDERGIWGSYNRAVSKMKAPLNLDSKYHVPLELFKDRKYSVFEALIIYLRDIIGLKNQAIAAELKKTASTIATVYNRARKK